MHCFKVHQELSELRAENVKLKGKVASTDALVGKVILLMYRFQLLSKGRAGPKKDLLTRLATQN